MARPAGGTEFLEAAITQAANAQTIGELRMAQALLLPLKFGLSHDDTGVALRLSKNWTLRLGKRFGRIQSFDAQARTRKSLRNRARMPFEAEAALLAPYIKQAKQGGVIIVPALKPRSKWPWVAPWRDRRCTRCRIATVGASWRPTNSTRSQTR